MLQPLTAPLCLFRTQGISFFLTFPKISQLLKASENQWNHCLSKKTSAALQIRCGAVKAVPGGFDSHALPPPGSITPGLTVRGFLFLQSSVLMQPAILSSAKESPINSRWQEIHTSLYNWIIPMSHGVFSKVIQISRRYQHYSIEQLSPFTASPYGNFRILWTSHNVPSNLRCSRIRENAP